MRGLFVGAGQFAEIQLEAWREVEGVRFVGICNRTLEKAKELAYRHNVQEVGADLDEMLRKLRPDFVDICTSVGSHELLVKTAVDNGVPVLCQKPICSDLESARELVQYAANRAVPLMVNDNWRWQPWYREIKGILESGVLGHVFSANLSMRSGDGWGAEPYAQQPYFRDMPRFLLLETGIHYFDTLRYLFGEVESMYCSTRRRNPLLKGEDQALAVFNFQSGLLAQWDANRAAYVERLKPPFNGFMRVDGSEGFLEVDEDGGIFLTLKGKGRAAHLYPVPNGFRGGSAAATQRHFIETLRCGGEFETSGEDYLRTTELVFAAYLSAEKGHPVELAAKL